MLFDDERTRRFIENKELCDTNPGFMICPRCNGTTYIRIESDRTRDYKTCTYCGGSGVITWIDRIIRGKRIQE